MSQQALDLAALLISYEADEPHVDLPDCDSFENGYPTITSEDVAAMLASEHTCTKTQGRCVRCDTACSVHKAEWLLERSEEWLGLSGRELSQARGRNAAIK